MILITVFNVFSSRIQAVLNNISVWWHVFGAALIIAILIITPAEHQDLKWMFTGRLNNSGFTGSNLYWLYVLPLGFLLTQYTITGFDASAHLSEETQSAHLSSAKGIWKSIFYSAIGGYILLLALVTALAFILFSPMLKGWRTQIFGYVTMGAGVALPLAGELVEYLQTLDWRQYVLASDKKNLAVLAIVGGLGFVGIVLRHMTTGRVGTRD